MTIERPPVGPTARGDVTLQRVGREAILHDARNGQAHVINGSAAQLWELLDGRSFDDLVIAFAALYGREPRTVSDDVRRTLDRFVRHREVEFGMRDRWPWGDAVVTGYGAIFGRKVFVLLGEDLRQLTRRSSETGEKTQDLAPKIAP